MLSERIISSMCTSTGDGKAIDFRLTFVTVGTNICVHRIGLSRLFTNTPLSITKKIQHSFTLSNSRERRLNPETFVLYAIGTVLLCYTRETREGQGNRKNEQLLWKYGSSSLSNHISKLWNVLSESSVWNFAVENYILSIPPILYYTFKDYFNFNLKF